MCLGFHSYILSPQIDINKHSPYFLTQWFLLRKITTQWLPWHSHLQCHPSKSDWDFFFKHILSSWTDHKSSKAHLVLAEFSNRLLPLSITQAVVLQDPHFRSQITRNLKENPGEAKYSKKFEPWKTMRKCKGVDSLHRAHAEMINPHCIPVDITK